MTHQKVLLLGGTGFLGAKIAELTPKNIKIWLSYRKNKPSLRVKFKPFALDLLDFNLVKKRLNQIRPQIVIHAARIYPFDDDPAKVEMATHCLTDLIRSMGAKLIYISSDAVFDGKKGNYREDDQPNPVTNYGQAKLIAEEIIKKNLVNFIMIRTSYLYNIKPGEWDKRTTELLNQIKTKKLVYRFKDMYRSPTLVDDLAGACWQLIEQDFSGVIHIAGKKKSVLQFSQEITKKLGYNSGFIKANYLKNSKLNIAPDTSLNTDLAKKIINF